MRENALFHVISITQASPGQSVGSSHVNAKCKPGSLNTLAQQLKSFKDHLRAALTMGTTRAQHECNPHPSHRRGSPHRRREPLYYARKHTFSCDFKRPGITRTKRWKQDHQTQWHTHGIFIVRTTEFRLPNFL